MRNPPSVLQISRDGKLKPVLREPKYGLFDAKTMVLSQERGPGYMGRGSYYLRISLTGGGVRLIELDQVINRITSGGEGV